MIETDKIKNEIFNFWETVDWNFPNLVYWESNFTEQITKNHQEIEKEISDKFSPLIDIFNLEFQWLTNLYSFLAHWFEEEVKLENQFLSYHANVGSACNYMSALRILILSGHDGPAKAILRSLTDILHSCIVICNDRDLSNQFVSTRNANEALKLWYKKLTAKKIHSALSKIELEVVNDDEVVEEFHAFREESSNLYSEFVHPWYQPALVSFLPPPINDPFERTFGLHGAASALLYRTLSECNKLIWYFSRLGWFIFDKKIMTPEMREILNGKLQRTLKLKTENSENSNLEKYYLSAEMGKSLINETISKYWDIDYEEYREKLLK